MTNNTMMLSLRTRFHATLVVLCWCVLLSTRLPTVWSLHHTAADDNCHWPADDFVPHLPGLNQPLPSPWYSGFVSYQLQGRTIHTHYVLIQAEDDYDNNNNSNKPLIYWSNGGPGASSLFGLLTELGPLLLSDDSLRTRDYAKTGIPTLLYNPNGWTRLGHVLMFDQPAPVGFSYCNNEMDSTSCAGLSWTDELASANVYAALQAFYDKFPCFGTRNTDLYLTGESYAGIYIPTLARRILQDKGSVAEQNLKGFAVGDGCLGTETGICGNLGNNGDGFNAWHVLFLFGHGQIPAQTFQEVMRACQPADDYSNWLHLGNQACQDALQKVDQQAGGYYEYNLYDDCTYRNGILLRSNAGANGNVVDGAVNDYACGGDIVMETYLSLPAVQQALHIPNNYFSVDNAENFDYTPTEKDLRGFYKQLATNNQENPEQAVRVLIYNGDADPSITSMASQNWTYHLMLPETESWRPWTVDGCRRTGGYVTRYKGDLDFLTIRGAGHMVPTYKAEATFAFLSAWIKNEDYPMYDKDCMSPSMTQRDTLIRTN